MENVLIITLSFMVFAIGCFVITKIITWWKKYAGYRLKDFKKAKEQIIHWKESFEYVRKKYENLLWVVEHYSTQEEILDKFHWWDVERLKKEHEEAKND